MVQRGENNYRFARAITKKSLHLFLVILPLPSSLPQDLVKELIHTKNHLHSAEEELKAVRGYLDNLLLRIMETNPGILSVGNL